MTSTQTTTSLAADTLLSIQGLRVGYRTRRGSIVQVIRDASLDLAKGESVALVGESGCGKTTLALAALRMLPKLGEINGGSIQLRLKNNEVVDLLHLGDESLRELRWKEASVVYQGAMNSLNPLSRVSTQFNETYDAHQTTMSDTERVEWTRELLQMVMLDPDRVLDAYPHQLSGGMRQRVMIAMALQLRPNLLVLDEPTTALDILTQRSIVQVLQRLQDALNFAMIFVTHDMALAAELSDRVGIMYAGEIVEIAPVDEIFYEPRHPYTIGLLQAIPSVEADVRELASIPGSPPSLVNPPPGCMFAPRCPFAQQRCIDESPLPRPLTSGHRVACHFAESMSLERGWTA